MGKIVSNFFISLDGVVESPNLFVFPYFNEEVGAAVDAGTSSAGAFLMGRMLYEEWSGYWPTSKDEPFASMINSIDKYVLSNTLTEPSWSRTTVIGGKDAADRVRRLKDEVEADIAVSGSPTTVGWLAENDLLDELHLLVFPIAVGEGKRLFEGRRVPLKLIDSASTQTGVMHLTYGRE